jgi:hypothetical protein
MSLGLQQAQAFLRMMLNDAERTLRGMRLIYAALPLLQYVLARHDAIVTIWSDGVVTGRRTVFAPTGELVLEKRANTPSTQFKFVEHSKMWDREVAFIEAPAALAVQLRRITRHAAAACVFAAGAKRIPAELVAMIVWEYVF